jgi:fatty acid amide hydrolase 2
MYYYNDYKKELFLTPKIISRGMIMIKEVLDFDAVTLAKQIQSRQISSLEATESYIAQLEKTNPSINALVEERFSQAILEAKRCDELLAKGEGKGELWGVPISMKESFHVRGMKTTGGLHSRKDQVETDDSTVVHRLKKEGAIILGKTNTPTLCFCQETVNKLYGRTNNPWNLSRTVGGSSGGEGAVIAVGGAAVGIGSDIGGSIRFPAHFNGVIGFKSGAHQVSAAGHYPGVGDTLQQEMLGIGAMAKSVADAQLINKLIADTVPLPVDLSSFQISVPPPHPDYPMDKETSSLIDQVRDFYKKSYSIDDSFPPYLEDVALFWQWIMSIDGGESVRTTAFGEQKNAPLKEWLNEKLFHRSEYHPYFTWALLGAKMFEPSPKQILLLLEQLDQAKQKLADYLKNRVLILPVYHRAAPPHGQVYKEIFSVRRTFLAYLPYIAWPNVFGLPSLTVPVGTDADGMPIALQWITAIGQEDALFKLAQQAEEAFRGYVRCTQYD